MDTWDCFFDFSVSVQVDELEGSWLGLGNVEAIKLQTPFPFLIFDPFWNPFQRPPGRGQGDMQFRLCIGFDKSLARIGIVLSQGEMVPRPRIDSKSVCDGFVDHPVERKFRETALLFRIAAANISVDAGEPNLLDILIDRGRSLVERIGDEALWLRPSIEPKHSPPLVEGLGVAENFHAGICPRVGQHLQRGNGNTTVPTRHDHRGNRVPYANEVDDDRSRSGHMTEVPARLKIVLFANLLVRAQSVMGDVELIGRQQPDHVDESSQCANRVGAAAKSEQKDAIVLLIILTKKPVGAENLVVKAISRRELEDAFRVLS